MLKVLIAMDGSPASEAACDQAANLLAGKQVDLLVLGRAGPGAIERFLLGSVSTKVSNHARCAVLLVHSKRAARTRPPAA